MDIKGVIFDLDGVIVDTAMYHYDAWKRMANELGFDFSKKDNEKLKGVSRMDSLNLILNWGDKEVSEEEKLAMAAKKNEWYIDYISNMSPAEILPGVEAFLEDLKEKGYKIALGSASKNAPNILKQVNLSHFFEVIIDGNVVTNGKPHPETFLMAADSLSLEPNQCVVFEDAEKGIEAALAAGMMAVGVGDPQILNHAHMVIEGFKHLNFSDIKEVIATLN